MLTQRLPSLLCVSAFAALVWGCGDTPTESTRVAAISLNYPEAGADLRNYVLVGEQLQLTAQPLDGAGEILQGVTLHWSSSNTSALEVSPTGALTGIAIGDAVITVQAGGMNATLPFTVLAPVASVELVPTELGLGDAQIEFVLKDGAGQVVPARVVSLASTNPSVATVSQQGSALRIHAGTPGLATLTISREGKSAQLPVTVTTIQFDTVDASGRACGLTSAGAAWCWGPNASGGLGYGYPSATVFEGAGWTPTRVIGDHVFSQISVGNSHTCALTDDGTAYCWGNNGTGALGVASPGVAAAPIAVSGGLRFSQISASHAYTCGVTTAGAAYCWGNNDAGQLGDGTRTTRFEPVPVVGGLTFSRVSTRWAEQFVATTCGLTPPGKAYCWGANFQTTGTFPADTLEPVAVAGGHTFAALSASGLQSCAVDQSGDAYCWKGLGLDASPPVLVPGGLHWRSVSVFKVSVCGVTTAGAGYCWGEDDGTANIPPGLTPIAVPGGLTFGALSAAPGYSCGLTSQGDAYCWGNGAQGQLGQNTLDSHPSPVRVLGQP